MEYENYNVWIFTKTGLHIGGSDNNLEIGGLDQSFITTRDGEPYIPGSSLKGKLRTLLELNLRKKNNDKGLHSCKNKDCLVCNLFGRSSEDINDSDDEILPTRLIFRDIYLAKEKGKELKSLDEEIFYLKEDWEKQKEDFFERKIENTIDREKGKTKDGGVRSLQRVPAGTLFKGELVVRKFGNDNDLYNTEKINSLDDLFDKLERYLENDYLGGQGTRGHGQVKIYFEKNE